MKTIRESKVGTSTLRIVQTKAGFTGAILGDGKLRFKVDGQAIDELWQRLHDEVGKTVPGFFGFDGAKARFLRIFPRGFSDPGYLARERDYKVHAKAQLDQNAPLERALAEAGLAEAVLRTFRDTNLLSQFEKPRMTDALRGPAADAFIRSAAQFASGETAQGLAGMAKALKPHDVAKWTAVTYLPYLWRPDAHMFLKPEATKNFAARVGHRFANDYGAPLDAAVYESLLDLAAETTRELSGLGPRDRIDVQSFIWVVGQYPVDEEKTVT